MLAGVVLGRDRPANRRMEAHSKTNGQWLADGGWLSWLMDHGWTRNLRHSQPAAQAIKTESCRL
jgi:hypothetical protein